MQITEANRPKLLKRVYDATHRDFKGTFEPPHWAKTIMVTRGGVTMLVDLEDLTDDEIRTRLPRQ